MKVILTEAEMHVAEAVGNLRQSEAVAKGLPDKHGLNPALGKQVHILGACGEMAFCKALNLYWPCSVNVFKSESDVGSDIEIRTRSKDWYDLLVREDDPDNKNYVLVTGQGCIFNVRGWFKGGEAKRPRFRKPYGNREPAYFVPQECLHSINEL